MRLRLCGMCRLHFYIKKKKIIIERNKIDKFTKLNRIYFSCCWTLCQQLHNEQKIIIIKETSGTTTSLKFLPMPVLTAKWLPHSNKVPSLNFLFVSDLRGLSLACWVNWWFQAECVYVRVCCCLSVIPPLDRRPNPGCTAPLTMLQLKLAPAP